MKFLESLFDFLAEPYGLSNEEIRKELAEEGIDIDELKNKIENMEYKYNGNPGS